MVKRKPLDPKLQADVDFLGTLLAKGISGLIEFGLSDGMKMQSAMKRIMASKASTELGARLWSQFFLLNPHASAAIELAAMANPQLGQYFEKMNMKAKIAEYKEGVQTNEETV